jgi:predicted nucleic acid-binding protein
MMEHFRVLPTDPRVKDLSDNQISLLMQFWLDYDEESMRLSYRKRKADEQAKPKYKNEDLKEIGYTDEEIEELTRGQ